MHFFFLTLYPFHFSPRLFSISFSIFLFLSHSCSSSLSVLISPSPSISFSISLSYSKINISEKLSIFAHSSDSSNITMYLFIYIYTCSSFYSPIPGFWALTYCLLEGHHSVVMRSFNTRHMMDIIEKFNVVVFK